MPDTEPYKPYDTQAPAYDWSSGPALEDQGAWLPESSQSLSDPPPPSPTPEPGQWRAPYSADGYTPGTPNETTSPTDDDPHRWQWQADSPLVPESGSEEGTTDPTAPVWDPTSGGSEPIPGWSQPAAGTVPSQRAQINAEMELIDAALDYNTVGVPGNIAMGGAGGLIGKGASSVYSRFANPQVFDVITAVEPGLPGAKPTLSMEKGGAGLIDLAAGSKLGWRQSMLKGAGISAAFMVADHYADKFLTGHDQGNGISKSINSITVPLVFIGGSKHGFLKAAGLSAATWLGGRVIGTAIGDRLPEGEHPRYSRWFRQGNLESILLAAEFVLPMRSNLMKAGVMATTWAVGRLSNGLLDPPPPLDTKEAADELMLTDARERTASSMNQAIDRYLELGTSKDGQGITSWVTSGFGQDKQYIGEAALSTLKNDWLTEDPNRHVSSLELFRGAVIRCTAFAESRMAHGTRLISENQTPKYILAGENLDLGGKAALEFWRARLNLDNAKRETQATLNQDLNGNSIEQSEIDELNRVNDRISQSEEKIYGAHDVDKIMGELSNLWKTEAVHAAKTVTDIAQSIALLRENPRIEPRLIAKLYRDLALLYLSNAENSIATNPASAAAQLFGDDLQGRQALDAAGKPRGYDGALDAIRLASELDPDNADLRQITAVSERLLSELPAEFHRS